ncbi:hypothetical protein N7539_006143 [Penicillium diatomitis]|uniref:Uncharacterized protein n=1 Tax=Penicillium diatomitis TaxID=2819901 RepID=A0A9W9X2H8_9EURO|nr:uncharacterized protein N7539_006143 [Penicillium diatomitis]KAJ5482697.1 hypothetical protein N7539_006143 [Penicillium diatomitis]
MSRLYPAFEAQNMFPAEHILPIHLGLVHSSGRTAVHGHDSLRGGSERRDEESESTEKEDLVLQIDRTTTDPSAEHVQNIWRQHQGSHPGVGRTNYCESNERHKTLEWENEQVYIWNKGTSFWIHGLIPDSPNGRRSSRIHRLKSEGDENMHSSGAHHMRICDGRLSQSLRGQHGRPRIGRLGR